MSLPAVAVAALLTSERGLARRYPTHRKLVGVAGRIERIAAASYLSYVMSAMHFRQWRKNERLAQQFGYR